MITETGAIQCLICGRFVKNVTCLCHGWVGDEIIDKVEGDCSRCGKVDLTESNQWDHETFFKEGD